MFVDEFAEGNGHFFLDSAGVVDVAGDAEEFGSGVALATERIEPVGATADDGWCHGDGFDVGDCRGATEKTDGGGKRGL